MRTMLDMPGVLSNVQHIA